MSAKLIKRTNGQSSMIKRSFQPKSRLKVYPLKTSLSKDRGHKVKQFSSFTRKNVVPQISPASAASPAAANHRRRLPPRQENGSSRSTSAAPPSPPPTGAAGAKPSRRIFARRERSAAGYRRPRRQSVRRGVDPGSYCQTCRKKDIRTSIRYTYVHINSETLSICLRWTEGQQMFERQESFDNNLIMWLLYLYLSLDFRLK